MKKSDIAMIILIAGVSAMVAFLIGSQFDFLRPDPKGTAVPTAKSISGDVPEADAKVFNSTSINPTVQTVIGGNTAGN